LSSPLIESDQVDLRIDIDAPIILDAFQHWVAPTLTKKSRFATVDPAYTGTGDPKVTFDGEATLSQKTYKYMIKPAASARVVMEPVGSGWIITGPLDGSTAIVKAVYPWTIGETAFTGSTTVTPQQVARIDIADPGWPYKLVCFGAGMWNCTTSTWYLAACIDSPTGAHISHYGPQVDPGPNLFQMGAFNSDHDFSDVLTGAHSVYLMLERKSGTGPLTNIYDANWGGLTVFQVPV